MGQIIGNGAVVVANGVFFKFGEHGGVYQQASRYFNIIGLPIEKLLKSPLSPLQLSPFVFP